MTKRINVMSQDGTLCPWTMATLLVKDMLQSDPGGLNRFLGLIRSRDLNRLCDVPSNPSEYQGDINLWLAHRQLAALFKKNEALTSDTATEAARKRFLKAEEMCRRTNRRLDFYSRYPGRAGEVWTDVQTMRKLIHGLLGQVNARVLNQLGENLRLTSGATEDRSRKRSLPFLKVTRKLRAPPMSWPYLAAALQYWGVGLDAVKFTPVLQNTVVLVPKNWKTHRTIAKEPTHSLPFQLSLDAILKGRLRRWGVDLSSQIPNQEASREGSLTGAFSTIDLEMASDTLSINTVAVLLPDDWYVLLNSFRSPGYKGAFGSGWYAKFSSMGNGYTFSLETLIFAAACKACGHSDPIVYGDDIVIPSELAPRLTKLLNFLGFAVNQEKSCISDQPGFRESCGVDSYHGRIVTPFYLRELPKHDAKAALCHIFNGLIHVSNPGSELWAVIRDYVIKNKFRLVPYNDDSMSGIFVTPHTAYILKKLKTRSKPSKNRSPWVPYYSGYGARTTLRRNNGLRSLWLWYLSKLTMAEEPASARASNRISSRLLALRTDSEIGRAHV